MANRLAVLAGAGLLAWSSASVEARTRIEAAYEAGELDLHTALLYQVLAVRDPGQLPSGYREQRPHPVCGTPALVQALAAATQGAPPGYVAKLAGIMARPVADRSALSPAGRFRVHYDLAGAGAVDPRDANGNKVPDYVDEVARTMDAVWALQIDSLGFQPPPSDGVLGGGPEYDVYLTDLAPGRAYGFTYPELAGKTTYSYLQLDNNYTDASVYVQTKGLDALHVTAAHEFNHAIQFGYYQGNDGIWWQEATATWMEEVAYPEVDDYLQYLDSFMRYPEKSLDSGSRYAADLRIYGASLFAHYLHQRHHHAVVRQIWEAFGAAGNAALDHFDRVIGRYDAGGLAGAVAEFAIWNYFTGPRHVAGYYAEGQKYPAVHLREVELDFSSPKVAVEEVARVDHLGSTYLRLIPKLHAGGVQLEVEPRGPGRWRTHLLLAATDSVQILPLVQGVQYVPSWDRYSEVVIVLTQVELTGQGYEYSSMITYDPDLIDVPPPLALRLGPVFPNPFRPALHGASNWRYDLDVASQRTRFSIYSASGDLVRSVDLGARVPRREAVSWDGTNAAGSPVASGIYYGVLEADGRRATAKVALIRGADE